MSPHDVCNITDAKVFFKSLEWDTMEITIGCSSDLMSDVLTLDVSDAILITGLANEQAIRTADMADIGTILLVRSKIPSETMLNLAKECDISLLGTRHAMFTACGLLMNAGLASAF